ncbi:MAG: NAD(P)H-binding protein [Microbacteriaceae bacterium]
MARLLIVGGTGTAGRSVVAEAVRRGHDVTVGARRVPDVARRLPSVRYLPLDLVSAAGLQNATAGINSVIDTTNGVSRAGQAVLTIGTRNLLHSVAMSGVERAVLLSIVNVDKSNFGYYRTKAAQERMYRESPVETRIVRATQFHDFVDAIFGVAGLGVIPAFANTAFQPIDTRDLAGFLVDAAEGTGVPVNGSADFGGPDVRTMRTLAGAWKAASGSRRPIITIPVPGAIGRSWRAGENLVPDRALGTVTFDAWLADRLPR